MRCRKGSCKVFGQAWLTEIHMTHATAKKSSIYKNFMGLCLCFLAFLLPVAGMAQAAGLTAADRADIKAFTITSDVFHRLEAVVTQARAMHIKREHLDMSRVHSLADMAKQMATADPRIKPLLAKNGFTPRQFLVANMSFLSTVVSLRQAQGTPQEQAVESHLNPANVRFYKKHKAAMDRLVFPPSASTDSVSSY